LEEKAKALFQSMSEHDGAAIRSNCIVGEFNKQRSEFHWKKINWEKNGLILLFLQLWEKKGFIPERRLVLPT